MDESLDTLDAALTGLERQVVGHYSEARADAEKDSKKYIRLSATISKALLEILMPMHKSLMGRGDKTRLELVSEQHDELRIRMMYINDLLRRDIPIDYMDRAFAAFKEFEPQQVGQITTTPAPIPSYSRQLSREADKEGFMKTMFAGVFGGKGNKSNASRQQANRGHAVSRSNPVSSFTQTSIKPNHSASTKKVVVLHHMMERDPRRLVKQGQELKPSPAPPFVVSLISRFEGRDFGEAHMARSKDWSNTKARSPEELRRKLANRDKVQDKKPAGDNT